MYKFINSPGIKIKLSDEDKKQISSYKDIEKAIKLKSVVYL